MNRLAIVTLLLVGGLLMVSLMAGMNRGDIKDLAARLDVVEERLKR